MISTPLPGVDGTALRAPAGLPAPPPTAGALLALAALLALPTLSSAQQETVPPGWALIPDGLGPATDNRDEEPALTARFEVGSLPEAHAGTGTFGANRVQRGDRDERRDPDGAEPGADGRHGATVRDRLDDGHAQVTAR